MKWSRNHTYSLLILLVLFAFAYHIYLQLPERAPVHWNIEGEPDAWGPRSSAAFLLPIIAAGMWLFIWILEGLIPVLEKRPYKRYQTIWIMPRLQIFFTLFMLIIYLDTVGGVIYPSIGGKNTLGLMAGLIFVGIGYLMRLIPAPEWESLVQGSDHVEEQVEKLKQRFALDRDIGRNFIVLGVLVIIVGFWSTMAAIVLLVVGGLTVSLYYGIQVMRKGLMWV